jgi:hypothetical protein
MEGNTPSADGGNGREVERQTTTRRVEPLEKGKRMAVGIALGVIGVLAIAAGAFATAPGGVRVALVVVGGACVLAGGYLIAGALRITPGGGSSDSGGTPGASGLPHVETLQTETIKETGLPKHGLMPPKQGRMPSKGSSSEG